MMIVNGKDIYVLEDYIISQKSKQEQKLNEEDYSLTIKSLLEKLKGL